MLFNETLDYYNKNAESFVEGTLGVRFTAIQDKFLKHIPCGGKILDFGCGSGRDTKHFIEEGFDVDAIDGSEELCKISSEYTGIEVRRMLFSELDEYEKYDGIWACSSILHLPKDELKPVLQKMAEALKSGGIVYTSFKYSEFEGVCNGRYFTNFTPGTFRDFIQDVKELLVEECWITGDVRPGRCDEKWLNLILRKMDIY